MGVELGGRIGLSKSSLAGITVISPPINKELSFGYTLVPLSAFFAVEGIYDVVVILGIEGIVTFEDIIFFDVGGVGWGVKSVPVC